MASIKLLVLIIVAFGLTNGKRRFRKCTFCRYSYTTGHSPYELLWILSDEISAYLTEDQRITLFLDEEDLTKAELVFETFCEKICNKDPLRVASEVLGEEAGTGPGRASRLDNKAFYDLYDSEVSPVFTMPNQRTLFKGIKIPPKSGQSPSAEKVSAGSSGITREGNKGDRLERAWGREVQKHSGEDEISGTLLFDGTSGVHSGSSDTGNDTASDEVGAAESETDCSDPPCSYYLS